MQEMMIESASVCIGGGPMSATVVGEVCLGLTKGARCYVTLVEVDDTAAFYLTEESIQEFLADPEEDPECEERMEELNTEHLIAAGSMRTSSPSRMSSGSRCSATSSIWCAASPMRRSSFWWTRWESLWMVTAFLCPMWRRSSGTTFCEQRGSCAFPQPATRLFMLFIRDSGFVKRWRGRTVYDHS